MNGALMRTLVVVTAIYAEDFTDFFQTNLWYVAGQCAPSRVFNFGIVQLENHLWASKGHPHLNSTHL